MKSEQLPIKIEGLPGEVEGHVLTGWVVIARYERPADGQIHLKVGTDSLDTMTAVGLMTTAAHQHIHGKGGSLDH